MTVPSSEPEPAQPSFAPQEDDQGPLGPARALAEGRAPSNKDYLALRMYLARQTVRRSGVARAEAEDIADEALTRFVAAANRGQVKPETALPYLNRIARNEAIDRLRKRRDELPESLEDQPMDDDAIARLIDSQATATILEAALALAARKKDFVCTKVANEWLREAAQQGRTPSSREVARRAGVSHVTVQRSLARLNDYVQEVLADFSEETEPPAPASGG